MREGAIVHNRTLAAEVFGGERDSKTAGTELGQQPITIGEITPPSSMQLNSHPRS
jgi:hypothetical protein